MFFPLFDFFLPSSPLGNPMLFLPEIYFIFLLCLLFTLGALFPFMHPLDFRPVTKFSFSGSAILSLFFLFFLFFGSLVGPLQRFLFNYVLYDDRLTVFFKLFLLLFFISYFLSVFQSFSRDGFHSFEFPLLFVFSLFSMYLMISCFDLLLFYLVLELQSFCFYILSAYRKESPTSVEAGLKYFTMGALSSAFLLFGISFVYFVTSTTNLGVLALFTSGFSSYYQAPFLFSLVFGLLFLISGLLFKLSFAPFHFWTPDVYDGSPFSVTAFYLVLSKIPLFIFLFRFLFLSLGTYGLYSPFPFLFDAGFYPLSNLSSNLALFFYQFYASVLVAHSALYQGFYYQPIVFLSSLSLFFGSFGAMFQGRLKRFFAYTTIAHTGYLGLALVSGVESFFFYLLTYSLTSLAFFSLFLSVRHAESLRRLSTFRDLSTLYNTFPHLSLCLGLTLFSMAGIPPLIGFYAKYYVLLSLFNLQLYLASFVLLFFSTLGAFYYLKTIRFFFFSSFSDWKFYATPDHLPLSIGFLASLVLFLSFIDPDLFLFPFKLLHFEFVHGFYLPTSKFFPKVILKQTLRNYNLFLENGSLFVCPSRG